MTVYELESLLEKYGHPNANVEDHGIGRITITTDYPVSNQYQEEIRNKISVGIKLTFLNKYGEEKNLPPELGKWYGQAVKGKK